MLKSVGLYLACSEMGAGNVSSKNKSARETRAEETADVKQEITGNTYG